MLSSKVGSYFDESSLYSTPTSLPQMRCVNIAIPLLLAGPVAAHEARSLLNHDQPAPADSNVVIILPGQAGYENASQPCTSLDLLTNNSECSCS